ncbi:MAG: hypothetical protein K2Y07_02280 [Nitrosomonas sp.]|nr:hypothetical protein [Nitrosomonas sp.]OQW83077.1 MAG: hypothetical protein BVN30_06895 [Proteobacteria bacterium ST_bin16]
MKKLSRILLTFFVISTLSGCLSPVALNRAVEVYDQAAIHAESRQLLINIARAQHHEPLHFTRVSSIAATFNFSDNAGVTPALTGESGGLLAPVFGAGVSENPTFSIDPIASDEFTKRLLTPFSQHKLTLLLRQHFDIDLMLRMMAQEVYLHHSEEQNSVISPSIKGQRHKYHLRLESAKAADLPITDFNVQNGNDQFIPGIQLTKEQNHRLRNRQRIHLQQTAFHNNPSDRPGYEMFRRIVLHLSAIQDQKQLYAEPLTFERSWTIPAAAISPEGLFQAIEKDFTVSHDEEKNTYTLSKQLPGPILITNYDPDILCCEERADLYNRINPWIENDVAFDIRPGYPGGEWPIRGAFRLRSFHTILNFIGHALGEQAEYYVEKDSRTLPIAKNENPSHTLGLIVADQRPDHVNLFTHSHGKYYAVDTTNENAHWNLNAFQLLYILFRLTVTDTKSLGLPITISK